jgi:hypothetical protein
MNSHSQLLQAIQYKGGVSCIYGTCYDETNWSQLVANYILFNLIKYNYNNSNNNNDYNNNKEEEEQVILLLNFDSHHYNCSIYAKV